MTTAGRIPKEFIEQLLARVDIVEVIGARIPLKKAGREYMACCPFHNEKTPSFTISPSKQFYHCFGCGVHGSSISFLMEYEHLEYIEAVEALARTAGVQVPRDSANNAPQRKKTDNNLYDLMERATQWFQTQLTQSPTAMAYLQTRQLDSEIIQRFGIGYAPAGWDNLSKVLAPTLPKTLLECGLVIQNDNQRTYDRFRERIMFPIRDRRGRIIGFGGRVLTNETPKYLNSPETPIFHKGTELYGLYEARTTTRQLNKIVVVEGYMDVIALAQFGISYAVATLGTATTTEHIQKLFRMVSEVIFCFDGDRAGQQAAWRALEHALPELNDERQIRFLFLPKGEDPDTYVRKLGQTKFEQALSNALPLTKFFLLGLKKQLGFQESYTLNVAEDRTRFTKEAAELLSKMPDILQKKQLIPEIIRLGNVDNSQRHLFNQYTQSKQLNTQPIPTKVPNQQTLKRTPMRHAIVLLLNFPHLYTWVDNPEQWIRYDIAGIDLFLTLLEIIETHPNINTASIIERLRDSTYYQTLTKLHGQSIQQMFDETTCEREFKDCLLQLKRQALQKKIDILVHKEQITGLSTQERSDLMGLLHEIYDIKS